MFLKSVAQYYAQTIHKSDWSDRYFVFTSNRAAKFFTDELILALENEEKKQNIKRNVLGIQTITIDKLFQQNSPYTLVDDTTLAFELYEVYNETLSANKTIPAEYLTFDFFYEWAKTFLSDFDDIDKYMVNAKDLFSNLADNEEKANELEYLDEEQRITVENFWKVHFKTRQDKFGNNENYHEVFIKFYSHLYEIYNKFRERLIAKGWAYNGLIYRDAAENDRFNINASTETPTHYSFIGFNALTTAERLIFNKLYNAKDRNGNALADFFWDYNPNLIKPIEDEKGKSPRYITVCGNKLPQPEGYDSTRFVGIYSSFYKEPQLYSIEKRKSWPKINVTKVAYPQGEVKAMNQWVKENVTNETATKCAIVLGDEDLLLPVLEGLPENTTANISMGYKIKYTQTYALLQLIGLLYTTNNKIDKLRTKTVLPILQNSIVQTICGKEANIIKENLLTDNTIIVDVCSLFKTPLLTAIFELKKQAHEFGQYIHNILTIIQHELTKKQNIETGNGEYKENSIEFEATYKLACKTKIFCNISQSYSSILDSINDPRTILSIWSRFIANEQLDFNGEPLKGLQIMGLMETRSLTLDKVCILSMNEGKIPNNTYVQTFIPRSLRYAYGLPTQEFHDSIFAYYFFRLICNAEKVELVFEDGQDDNEISRFILQLEYQFGLKLNKRTINNQLKIVTENNELKIEKDHAVMEKMYVRFGQGDGCLSPSAISSYLDCGIRFYFNYIVGIKESNDFVEEAEAKEIGSIYHEVMEHLLTENETMTSDFRNNCLKNIDNEIIRAFNKVMNLNIKSKDDLQGRNYLNYMALKKYIEQTIYKEKEGTYYEKPEEKIKSIYKIDDKHCITIGGTIDRKHRLSGENGILHILDYKTGQDKTEIKDLGNYSDFTKHQNKVIMQTLLYGKILKQNKIPDELMFDALKVVDLFKEDFDTALKHEVTEEIINGKNTIKNISKKPIVWSEVNEIVEPLYDKILKENIFNPDIPFESANDSKTCKNCNFEDLCRMLRKRNNYAKLNNY